MGWIWSADRWIRATTLEPTAAQQQADWNEREALVSGITNKMLGHSEPLSAARIIYEHLSKPSPFAKYLGEAADVVTPVAIEPSPLDKALEDFVAKRKAKREGYWSEKWESLGHKINPFADGCSECGLCALEACESNSVPTCEEYKRRLDVERNVGRAMSRLAPHETEIHERLMPYRGKA